MVFKSQGFRRGIFDVDLKNLVAGYHNIIAGSKKWNDPPSTLLCNHWTICSKVKQVRHLNEMVTMVLSQRGQTLANKRSNSFSTMKNDFPMKNWTMVYQLESREQNLTLKINAAFKTWRLKHQLKLENQTLPVPKVESEC